MIRSTLVAGAAAVSLTACATFTDADVVADVAGREVTIDEFSALSSTFFERPEVFQTNPVIDGRVDALQARTLLDVVVRQQISRAFLDDQGIDVSADRALFVDELRAQFPADQEPLPDDMFALIADLQGPFNADAVNSVGAPDIDTLERRYSQDPASLGLICVRHILVDTESEARSIRDAIADGAEFASLASVRSNDPASAVAGGALSSPDNECLPLDTARQSFDPAFTAGIIDARPGVATGPVESSLGWHVILIRPWSEVAESVGASYQPGAAGALLFSGFRATADVEIDPRYGTWNQITETVEPIG